MSQANTTQKSFHDNSFYKLKNNTKLSELDDKKPNWVDKKFAYKQSKIRLATMFSGIGAVEFAMKSEAKS